MTTKSVSPSSSANLKKARTYAAAIYSIVAAIAVLVTGAILKDDGILILPAFLLGIMAIACTGEVILDVKRHPHHRFSKF
jgi:hypothetical protein